MKLCNVKLCSVQCCSVQLRHDCRTAGLFNVGFEGDGMVALNSKTYCCRNETDTKTCIKGVGMRTNSLGREELLAVLGRGPSVSGTNKGFVLNDNQMCTYTQTRTGLTYP